MKIFGYLDPGTGSIFVQAVIGMLLAGGVIFRGIIRSIAQKTRALFSRHTALEEDE